MNIEFFNFLNETYKNLCASRSRIVYMLKSAGYEPKHGFYNNHSVRIDGEFVTEYYPIPVISVSGIGDIGIDIDGITLEAVLTRQQALELDYEKLLDRYDIEVYGAEDFLSDFYNKSMSRVNIIKNIEASNETKICVLFKLGMAATAEELLEVISIFG